MPLMVIFQIVEWFNADLPTTDLTTADLPTIVLTTAGPPLITAASRRNPPPREHNHHETRPQRPKSLKSLLFYY
nr:hypothetical protein [Tanacetum cinerariifolium]